MSIDGNYIIEKRNILNELRAKNMTLQELRLFSIYLAKINPRNIETRKVRFLLDDFQKVMDLGRLNIQQLKSTTDNLLSKIVQVPNTKGGFQSFVLFQSCSIEMDDDGVWFVELNASDNALDLMFNFRQNYFNYKLWNALSLKSANQLRMYEILKQHEHKGELIIKVEDLKEMLGIDCYDRFDAFKSRVLDSCQKALQKYTDIKYTYEKAVAGRGGKWISIKFIIEKNEDYEKSMELNIEKFLPEEILEEINPVDECKKKYLKHFSEIEFKYLRGVCENALLLHQIDDTKIAARIMINSLNLLEVNLEKTNIGNKTTYIAKILESQVDKEIEKLKKQMENSSSHEQSYDINSFEDFAITFSKNIKKSDN